MKKEFYVYLIRDQRPDKINEPIYVGKGQGYRAFQHLRNSSNLLLRRKVAKAAKDGLPQPLVEIVKRFELEADAFTFEVKLIARYGRLDLKTGTLCNLTNGGEGCSGSLGLMLKFQNDPVFAAEHRARVLKTQSDPEFIKARDERWNAYWQDPEYCKRHSERMRRKHKEDLSYKAKMLEAARLVGLSPENAERMRQRNLDPTYQIKCTEGWLRKRNNDPEFAKQHSDRESNKMRNWHAKRKFLEQEIGIPFNERWNPPHGRY